MSADFHLILSSLMFGLFCVVGLVEHSLYGGLNRAYYTHGLPLVIQRVPVRSPDRDLPPAELLQAQFRSALIGSLIFEEIAADTYAFRRRFFQSSLFPDNLMHGMLLFDRGNGQVVLKGFINVLVPLLMLAVGTFSVLGPFPVWFRVLPPVAVGLIAGIPLVLERRRCEKLAHFAAEAWNTAPGKEAVPQIP